MKKIILVDHPVLYGAGITDGVNSKRMPLAYTRDKGLVQNIIRGHDNYFIYETLTITSLDGDSLMAKKEALEKYKVLLEKTTEDFVNVRITYQKSIDRLIKEIAILETPDSEVVKVSELTLLK